MKHLQIIFNKKSISRLLIFLLTINSFMFTDALFSQSYAAPVINEMNINTTDNEVSVSGTSDGNGVPLSDKPFRYSIGSSQSDWVRDSSNIVINETLTSGALSSTQVINNTLTLATATASGSGIEMPSGGGLEGYAYSKAITIDHTKIDSELTNFPATVYLNESNFDFTKCKPDGSDIRFTDKDFNPLKFERVEHDFKITTPAMAGFNSSIGKITSSSDYGVVNGNDYWLWKAFDNNTTTIGASSGEKVGHWIKYEFTEPTVVCKLGVMGGSVGTIGSVTALDLYGSLDDVTYVKLASLSGIADNVLASTTFNNTVAYKYYKTVATAGGGSAHIGYREIQLYGLPTVAQYNVLIPMVSDLTDTDFYMWYGNPNAYNYSIESWQDKTGKQITYNGNVKLVPNVAKFGKAAYFDGTSYYLSTPDSTDFDFGTGDFTYEGNYIFNNLPTSGTVRMMFSRWTSTPSVSTFYAGLYNNSGIMQLNIACYSNGTPVFDVSTNWTPTIGRMYNIAFVRYSGNILFFVDGKLIGTSTANGNINVIPSTIPLEIGRYGSGLHYFNGYIDEVRISNIARWTSNFTPPQEPYTVDQYTKLLLHLDDFDALRIATSTTGSNSIYYSKGTVNTAKTTVVEAEVKVETYGTAGTDSGPGISNGSKSTAILLKNNSIVCNSYGSNPYTYTMDTTSAYHVYRIELQGTTEARFYVDGVLIHTAPYSALYTVTANEIWFGDGFGLTNAGGSTLWKCCKYNLDYSGAPTVWVEWNTTMGLPSASGWTAFGSATLTTLASKDETGKAVYAYGDVKPIKTAYDDGARGAYFDGLGDYFTVPNSADLNFSSGAFCIETVVMFLATTESYFLGKMQTASPYQGWYLNLSNTDKKVRLVTATNTTIITSTTTLSAGIEYKIKISSNGTTISLYINNVLQGSYNGALQEYNTTLNIGWTGYGPTAYAQNGYNMGLRITKGRSRVDEAFPDKLIVDGSDVVFCTNFDTIYDQNYAMVQHMGDSLIDATGINNSGSNVGTVVANTALGKARLFDGIDDYIEFNPTGVADFGTRDFSITYVQNRTNDGVFIGNRVTDYRGMILEYGGDRLYASTGADSSYIISGWTMSPVIKNQIVGRTLARRNGVIYSMQDGVPYTSIPCTGSIGWGSDYMDIGNYRNLGTGIRYAGTVNELRISKYGRSDSWNKAENLSLMNQLLTFSMYAPTGTRESEVYDISGYLTSSRVDWIETKPTGTAITVESNVSIDGGSSWLGWKPCTNGVIIADLDGSQDTSDARLKLRQTLSTSSSAITPILSNSIITIGMSKYVHRISAAPNKEYTVRFEVKDVNGSTTSETRTVFTKAQAPLFTVSSATVNSIDLLFSGSNPENTEYQIMCDSRYINSSGVLTSVPTWITLEDKEITVLGLNIGTMYSFTAKARNDAGEETDYASPIYTGTQGIPVPSGSAVIAATSMNNSVTVAWNEIQNSLSYELETDGAVRNVGLNTYYVHKDLMTGTQHTYRVRGRNQGGFSDWSELCIINTTSNLPLIPTNVLAKSSNHSVTVYWSSAQDALSYTVEIEGTQITDVERNSACLYGLEPETSYTYKVKSCNLIGESEWSETGTVTTNYLNTPEISTTQMDSNEIKIGWEKVKGATSYKIALDADENYDEISGSELDEFTTSSSIIYTHDNLPAKAAHVYRVCAISVGGESAWSDSVTLETRPQRPDVPGNFRGSASNNFINLVWDAVEDAIGYDLEVDGIVIENSDVTQYQYKGLDQYTEHTYRVRSVTKEMQSYWSDMLKIKTLGGIPNEPKNVLITNSRGIATVDWDKTPGAQIYDIEVNNNNIYSISVNSFNYGNIDLIPSSSTIYRETTYRIRAGNEIGKSDWTDYFVNNAIMGQIQKGKELDLGLTASNIMDFSRYTLYVNYNADALTVTDLCAYSIEKELRPGMVEGHDIEIVSFIPGHIVFRVNKIVDEGYLWTGIINNIKYIGNATGGTTLTYTAQCAKD